MGNKNPESLRWRSIFNKGRRFTKPCSNLFGIKLLFYDHIFSFILVDEKIF